MAINAIAPYQTTPLYTKNATTKPAMGGELGFTMPEAVTATQKSSALYEEISGKYDVRNATFEELSEISKILYEAGEITLKEHALITFDFGRATDYLKQNAPGYVSADFSMYKTAANSNGQRDWLAEFGARAADHFKFGNLVGYQTNSKVFAILEKLATK
ncbi:hypothetical protein [Sporosarcina sp. FSL K6-2383]|uniref:hypothetical protein n=1 Tax=Sporosarcina sp. FSL K6-2383 TaxID=2921556 RepID=UPI003159E0D2